MNIFTYWNSTELPLLNKYCIQTWEKHNPECKIILLNNDNLDEYVKTLPNNFNKLIVQHKSDYIRTYLLYHYGGVWIDCTIIINTHLSNIFDLNNITDIQLFKSRSVNMSIKKKYTNLYERYYFENSFICCLEPNNKFLGAILENFSWCIDNMSLDYSSGPNDSIYFKRLYSNKIKNHNHFRLRGWSYYLTHMNIIAILLKNSNIYHTFYKNINKNINYLFHTKGIFSYDNSSTHLKLERYNRKLIKELIENGDLIKHKELEPWFDFNYFLKQNDV